MSAECRNVYGTYNAFRAVPPNKAKRNSVVDVTLKSLPNGRSSITETTIRATNTYTLKADIASSELVRIKNSFQNAGYQITTACKP